VFDLSKYGLDIGDAPDSQGPVLLREQIISSLCPEFSQLQTGADLAIALGSGALRFERALSTLITLVNAPLHWIAIVAGVAGQGSHLVSIRYQFLETWRLLHHVWLEYHFWVSFFMPLLNHIFPFRKVGLPFLDRPSLIQLRELLNQKVVFKKRIFHI
jgi:hypothetical protein